MMSEINEFPISDQLDPSEPRKPETSRNFSILKSQKAKRNTLIGLTVLIAILSGAIVVLDSFKTEIKKQMIAQKPADSVSNVLLVLDSSVNDDTAPTALKVEFNHPVDLHEFEHAVTVIPNIEGKWVQDKGTPNSVWYEFASEFKGQFISVYIGEGLVSENNRTLIKDYENHFTMKRERQNREYSRVRSYPMGSAIELKSFLSSVNIYKSNAQNLLSFLRYSVENDKRGGIYDGTYTQDEIKHSERDKLTNIKSNDDEDTIYLDPGVYYVENDDVKPYFIVVSSFGVALRQDDQQVMFGVFDIHKGTKISDGVTFGLYNLKNSVNLIKDFKYAENTSQSLVYPTRLDAAIAIYKDEVAFVPVELPNSLADIQVSSNLDTDSEVFIYTDRPIYKPGDTVFVRGIVRQDSDSLYKLPPAGTSMFVRMNQGSSNELNQVVTLDQYGSFSTHFVLSNDFSSEYAYIEASVKPFDTDYYTGYGVVNFEVKKYVKPEFEIKTRVDKSEQLRSDKLKFTISGNYFDGKPLQGKEISYTLYTDNYYEVEKAVYNQNFNIMSAGGMCGGGGFEDYFGNEYHKGSVRLNDQGEAVVEVDSDKNTLLSQEVTLVAKVNDSNNNELLSAANTIVHAAEFNIFFIPSATTYSAGEELVAPFYAESLSGEKKANTQFTYELVRSYYNNNDTTTKTLLSGTVVTDGNGKGIVKVQLPKEVESNSDVRLVVKAKDSKDNVAENQKGLNIIASEAKNGSQAPSWGGRLSQTYLKITSNQNTFKVNDTVNLSIESPKDLDVLLTLERGRIYSPKFVRLQKGTNQLQFPITEDLSPSISVVFTFFVDGQYYSEGLSLNAPAMHKLLNVDLRANKDAYSPDETAELTIKTTDAKGAPVAAQLSVGVVDKAIYALRKSATPPVHSSFYYFRSRRTNASSSLTEFGTWGGWGGGGGGGGGVGSAADVLYWNPDVRTDGTGEVRLPIPLLGYKTIWNVQVIGSTTDSQVGQADTEFTVTSEVKGASTERRFWWW